MEKIEERLKHDFDKVASKGHEIVGIFLQGSQNYGLDYEESDIDTKAIIVPTLEDVVLNKKPVSTTLILETDEHIDLKDIRLMFDCFKKQNINFVEILFTKHRYINPKYEELFQPMLDSRETIARYNNYAALSCMVGMMMEKLSALEHPYPSKAEVLSKFGYDPKQLHHIIRLSEFIDRFFNGESYEKCLISGEPDFLISVKRGLVYNLEDARELADALTKDAREFKQGYMERQKININSEVDVLMNKTLLGIMSKSFGIK